MKHLLLIGALFCMGLPLMASKIMQVDSCTTIVTKPTIIAIPNNSTITQLLGRRLTLKEKLGLLFVRTKYKKGIPIDTLEAKNANKMATWGFIFSIFGYFFFPFIIPGYILSNNALKKEKAKPGLLTETNKTLAQIGKVFAIVWAALLIIALFVVIVILSGLRWR